MMTHSKLPGLPERIKALIGDTVVLMLLMILFSSIFQQIENVPNSARVIAFVFVFVLYDPLLTSILGGTIGHLIVGIRVKRSKNTDKNILFPLAILRFVCKSLLGWISLLTVSAHEEKKAIHDLASGSIVIYKQ